MKQTRRKILIWFESVICSSSRKAFNTIVDPPNDGALTFLCDVTEHFDVFVYTQHNSKSAVRAWFKRYGGKDLLKNVKILTKIKPADIIVASNAIKFEGVFPSVSRLVLFKTV